MVPNMADTHSARDVTLNYTFISSSISQLVILVLRAHGKIALSKDVNPVEQDQLHPHL